VSLGVLAVALDDFTRDDAVRRRCQDVGEVVIGVGEMEPDRIAVDDLDAGDFGVVIEAVPVFLGQRFLLVEADDLAVKKKSPR
jgi:hypothetical protein